MSAASSSLEQKLSRLQERLRQEKREAKPQIDLSLDLPAQPSPRRTRPVIVVTLASPTRQQTQVGLTLQPPTQTSTYQSDGQRHQHTPTHGAQHTTHTHQSTQACLQARGTTHTHHSVNTTHTSPTTHTSHATHTTPPGNTQHGTVPRFRQTLQLPPSSYGLTPRSLESVEIDQKLQEIMNQTGFLTLDGKRYRADISELETLGEMGSGTCGQVWKMRYKPTSHILAVKQMRRSGNKDENKRILMDLDVVLKSHDCPYIVQCHGSFITNTDVFIAMELMGTCAEKLKKRIQGPIPENILGKMTVAIVKALSYLKEKHGVIHRDVKPSNILLDSRGRIKLCDFGISGRLVDSKAKTRGAGCAAYMAPERIDPPDPTHPDYDIRADVWSLGISLVELATGQFPYQNCKTDFEVLTKVLQEDPPLLPSDMGFSLDFQAFVKDCLTKDHRKRPKYNKLLEHAFLRRYERVEVDVATWFRDVMASTESPRAAPSHAQPFSLR
ncbi:dual specificity mitogen-activated protein kinase kinase 7 isoform X1 [Lampetra planeri]